MRKKVNVPWDVAYATQTRGVHGSAFGCGVRNDDPHVPGVRVSRVSEGPGGKKWNRCCALLVSSPDPVPL